MGELEAVMVKLNAVPTVPAAVSGLLVMIGAAVVTVRVTALLKIVPEALVTATS